MWGCRRVPQRGSKICMEDTIDGVFGADVDVDPDPPSHTDYGEPVTVTVTGEIGEVGWRTKPMLVGETINDANKAAGTSWTARLWCRSPRIQARRASEWV